VVGVDARVDDRHVGPAARVPVRPRDVRVDPVDAVRLVVEREHPAVLLHVADVGVVAEAVERPSWDVHVHRTERELPVDLVRRPLGPCPAAVVRDAHVDPYAVGLGAGSPRECRPRECAAGGRENAAPGQLVSGIIWHDTL